MVTCASFLTADSLIRRAKTRDKPSTFILIEARFELFALYDDSSSISNRLTLLKIASKKLISFTVENRKDKEAIQALFISSVKFEYITSTCMSFFTLSSKHELHRYMFVRKIINCFGNNKSSNRKIEEEIEVLAHMQS
mmetsp:Transcript_26585/g.40654  ORF Transcript_26585/g.40654 Transcript_26585/m.40654 type:complete len:138 (+) Transcript_26585:130-543(+)